jgi:hypothetical protein
MTHPLVRNSQINTDGGAGTAGVPACSLPLKSTIAQTAGEDACGPSTIICVELNVVN